MKILKWSGSFFMFCLLYSYQTRAQNSGTPVYSNSHYVYAVKTTPLTTSVTPANVTSASVRSTDFTMDVIMPPELTIPQRKINMATLFVKVNLGDDYVYGPNVATTNAPLDFGYKINFDIKAYNGAEQVPGIFEQSRYELIIENEKPEAIYVKNFSQYTDILANAVQASDFVFQHVTIDNVTITPLVTAASSPSTQASMLSAIANALRFEISYDIAYGLHAGAALLKPVITPLGATKQVAKQLTFTWNSNGYEFPNYEVQLLRLYNTKTATAITEKQITTDIDWSKALTMETQSSNTSLSLTMAEGTGFYVWRVRPIGTYYDGGIANDLNYTDNNWSINAGNATGVNLQFTDANGLVYTGPDKNAYFYYEDIAADKNWIYSRTFTEENKINENLTYATPLQQIRQTQSYRVSKDKTIVSQTVPDNTGRSALSTMGVPVDGKVGDYKTKFIKKEGGTAPYSAQDYDQQSNYNTPSRIDQNNTPLSYYSDQNPDLTIPNAEGYPFQRTIFYNDGTQRVKEQSGVGRTHMVGDGSNGNGGGKTTKTLYSTPSESELISLFGDEAPAHESVLKTINIDPNNTASVSYTSKEGNVIATGLSFQDGEGSTLEPLHGEGPSSAMQSVKDAIRKNVSSEKGFISSKRIALLQTTPMDITYKVKCQELENSCLDLELDCKYKVTVIIHNVDNPSATIVLPSRDLSATVACTPDASGVAYKSVSWSQQTLAPGTYVIEKILEAGDPAIVVESKAKAENQIMPLIAKITGWLDAVHCEAQLQDFYTNLTNLENDINNAFTAGSGCNAACVVTKYALGNFTLTAEHSIQMTMNAAGKPEMLFVKSPCCGTIPVSVAYIPPFRCPAVAEQIDVNANGKLDVNANFFETPGATEYFPDFEGYAWGLLKDCASTTFTQAIFYSKYMKGWSTPGDFNKMIFHMLTDKYNAQGVEAVAGTQNANPSPPQIGTDDCGNPIANTGIVCDPNTNTCTQYTCSQLIDCWTQQVVLLRNSICGDSEYDSEKNTNVSNRTDENAGETQGSGKTHNGTFDDNFNDVKLSRRKKRKLKKKISQTMRDLSAAQLTVDYAGFLVKDFLDCTGYKFAKILTTADPTPLSMDVKSALKYNVPFVNGKTTGVTGSCPATGCKKWPYNPPLVGGVAWQDVVVVAASNSVPAKTLKDYFPNVRDPLYAFKYFEYPQAVRDIELLTCYSDPNDCYKTDASGALILSGGKPVKIPCCFVKNTDGTYSAGPLCETPVTVPGNGNYSSSNSTNYDLKYFVKNFCDRGKVVCPYNADGWSAGQRYTFYTLLNSYKPMPQEEDDESVLENPLDYTNQPMGIYDENNLIGMTADDVTDWRDWNNITAGTSFITPTVVKFEMTKMAKTCEGKCEERRAEFKNKLILSFTQNGYVIGGCKGSATDNVVPEDDLDLLVEEIYQQCKLQCPVTTYKIETAYCRKINREVTLVGPTNSNVEIEYGVGGCSGNCPGNVSNCQDNTCDPVTGSCPPESTLSHCEQKKWRQVMTWDFEIDMPSMLDANNDSFPDGSTKFNCIANPNMADYTIVPNSINSGAPPDINNFKTAKTVSPSAQITLSLPAKN